MWLKGLLQSLSLTPLKHQQREIYTSQYHKWEMFVVCVEREKHFVIYKWENNTSSFVNTKQHKDHSRVHEVDSYTSCVTWVNTEDRMKAKKKHVKLCRTNRSEGKQRRRSLPQVCLKTLTITSCERERAASSRAQSDFLLVGHNVNTGLIVNGFATN